MLSTRLHVSPYERRHRRALLDLTWTSLWIHKHLDWYKTRDWIDREDARIALAWQGDQLVGFLGLSPPQAGYSWIRLLGIRNGEMPGAIITELWRHAEVLCRQRSITSVVMLMSNNWCGNYLAPLGFAYYDDLITYSYINSLGAHIVPPLARVYPAEREHLADIARIDRQAFQPPWRMSNRDLLQALRIADRPMVAEYAGAIVGYEISTRNQDVAHLARLAVAPAHQNRRIGSALLSHLIANLGRRGVQTLSVNTQLGNLPSQRLYTRFGFIRTGFDIEVWHKRIC